MVTKDNKSIGFSGDSTYCEGIEKIIESSDVSVLDMIFPNRCKAHMGVDDIEFICNKFNKKIVSTHMSNQARDFALERNIDNLIVPNDGDEIEV